ncbi:MAG: MBOAT family protein, partial [Cyclobacteriaceae bacterium]
GNNRNHIEIIAKDKFLPSPFEFIRIIYTFGLTVIAWIFFRAENIGHALLYLKSIFSKTIFSTLEITPVSLGIFILIMVAIEWTQRHESYGLQIARFKAFTRWALYLLLTILVMAYFGEKNTFIYFQF